MMDLNPVMLRDALKMCMRESKHSVAQVASLAQLCSATVYNFRRGQTVRLTDKVRGAIEEYLSCHGFSRSKIIERLGNNTPDATDNTQLAKMGILTAEGISMSSQKPGKHYICQFVDDWEFAQLVECIVNSRTMDNGRKQNILGRLFPLEFPTLTNHQ